MLDETAGFAPLAHQTDLADETDATDAMNVADAAEGTDEAKPAAEQMDGEADITMEQAGGVTATADGAPSTANRPDNLEVGDDDLEVGDLYLEDLDLGELRGRVGPGQGDGRGTSRDSGGRGGDSASASVVSRRGPDTPEAVAAGYFGHFCAMVHLEFLTELAAIRRRVQRSDTARLVKLGWALGPMQARGRRAVGSWWAMVDVVPSLFPNV